MSDDELEFNELTFDEMVDRMREPLAQMEAVEHELDPATREFVRALRAALDRYDADAYDELIS